MAEGGVEIQQPVQERIAPFLDRQIFDVFETKVKLSYSKFTPEGKETFDPQKAVIFLPGWPWSSHAKATWDLPRWLANYFGLNTYNIDTVTQTVAPNTANLEAEALRQFIESNDLKEVTIFGHSEGAIKAAELGFLLQQKNPQIMINGIVLANPMGFYPQSFPQLAKNFVFVEIAQVEQKQKNPSIPHMPQIRMMLELLGSIWQDVKATKLRYPWMFAQQMKEMMRINSTLDQLKAPILVLTTDQDFVSNYRKYLPEQEIEKMIPEPKEGEPPLDGQDKKIHAGKARRIYLREHLFPNANQIGVIVASKYGSHIGLPVERYQSVARVVSKIFDRLRR